MFKTRSGIREIKAASALWFRLLGQRASSILGLLIPNLSPSFID